MYSTVQQYSTEVDCLGQKRNPSGFWHIEEDFDLSTSLHDQVRVPTAWIFPQHNRLFWMPSTRSTQPWNLGPLMAVPNCCFCRWSDGDDNPLNHIPSPKLGIKQKATKNVSVSSRWSFNMFQHDLDSSWFIRIPIRTKWLVHEAALRTSKCQSVRVYVINVNYVTNINRTMVEKITHMIYLLVKEQQTSLKVLMFFPFGV